MVAKRPLLDTAADQRLYVPDSSRKRAGQLALQRRHNLIIGDAGSGKTSLLYHIRADAATTGQHPLVILLDARLAGDARELVDLILLEATDAGWIEARDRPNAADPFGAVTQIRFLRDAPENAMVLIDEPTPEQSTILFGRLRDELWQLPIWFTVAVRPSTYDTSLSQPPADAFFDSITKLEPFDPDTAFEMLRRRKHNGELEGAILPPSSPLQPRAILLDADAGPLGARHDAKLQRTLLEAAERHAGRVGVMLTQEIIGRGAVSASDENLQKSLGVGRVRLTELMGDLEKAGVLRAYRATPQGTPGRPPTMYDINPNLTRPA